MHAQKSCVFVCQANWHPFFFSIVPALFLSHFFSKLFTAKTNMTGDTLLLDVLRNSIRVKIGPHEMLLQSISRNKYDHHKIVVTTKIKERNDKVISKRLTWHVNHTASSVFKQINNGNKSVTMYEINCSNLLYYFFFSARHLVAQGSIM